MISNILRHCVLAGLISMPGLLTTGLASPTYQPIAGFVAPARDPSGGLVSDGSGNLWGTTENGGPTGNGTVFKVNQATGILTIVVDFDNSTSPTDNSRGATPSAGLVSDGLGNFWGTTPYAGAHGAGTVFKVNVATGAITTVVDFDNSTSPTDNSRGALSQAGLASDGAGDLWGTTNQGGVNSAGTVFKVNVATGAITTVVDFDNSTTTTDNSRGASPSAGLVSDGAGNLWGTTLYGGANGDGTVFNVNVAAGNITTVADFDDSSTPGDNNRGGFPAAGLVSDGAGNFWGATEFGGTGDCGTVFEVSVATGVITTVVDFDSSTSPTDNSRGYGPIAGLVSDGVGNLWGTTESGGTNGWGTVFEVKLATKAITTVVDFDNSTSTTDNSRGSAPLAGLVSDGAGNLWGTTELGGVTGQGTVFNVNVGTGAITTVTDVGVYSTGVSPNGGLVSDGAGNLWGTTESGGTNNVGTVFNVNVATGAITTVVNFDGSSSTTDNSRGVQPQAGLVSDGAGNLWGTTASGGTNGWGTVYKVNVVTGAITTVVDFDYSHSTTDNSRGAFPYGGLVSDGAGNLWGTTNQGGVNTVGTVFKVNVVTGVITTLVDFDGYTGSTTDNSRGGYPTAGLVSDGAGNLWGTNAGGGASAGGAGTVFKVNVATGAITTVVDFDNSTSMTDNSRGAQPHAGLVSDRAGNLWGTTLYGGANGDGTVFNVDVAAGNITTVVDFDNSTSTTDNSRGGQPQAGLVSDQAGNLWGTTSQAGANNVGTVFQVNVATGAITTVFDFTGAAGAVPGASPAGSLLFTGNVLYGTTASGGVTSAGVAAGGGEIFSISLSSLPPVAANATAVETGTGAFTIGIPSGDSDPSGAAFTITNVSEPTLGSVVWTGTSITYTPNVNFAGFAGTDTFTYTITDSNGQSATGEITVGNPYYLQKGNFAGTLSNSGGGYMTLTTTGKGTFSGKLRQALDRYSLTGTFSGLGVWSGAVGGKPLVLHFNIGNVTGSAFGQYEVTGSYGGAAFTLYHALYNSTSDPAPQVGSYTMLIEPPAQVTLTQATATVTVTAGKISGVVIGSGGTGYNTTPMVTISSPTGKGATAAVTVVNGSITTIKFTSAGSGYPSSGVKVAISAPSGNPPGFGYATLSVTESGAVNISGKLADGTAFTDGVYITGGDSPLSNNFPVYVPLAYKQAGSLVGQLTFEDVKGVSDCDGILAWSKPAQTAAGLYQQGFDLTASAIGSRYSAQSKGSLSLALANSAPNATLTLDEQGWNAPIVKTLTVSPVAGSTTNTVTVTNPGTDALSLTINGGTGAFSGAFIDPATGKSTSINGVLFTKQSMAGGYFLSPNASGSAILEP